MTYSHHFLKVALPVPLRRCFDYLPPVATQTEKLQPGVRIEVPFGKRRLIGVLIEISDSSSLSVNRLKPALRVIDHAPVISREIMALAHWCANYYQHPLGEVMATVLPAALRNGSQLDPKSELYYLLSEDWPAPNCASLKRAPRQAELVELIRKHPEGISEHSLKALGLKGPALNSLMDKGWVIARKVEAKPHRHAGNILAELPLELNQEQQLAVAAVVASLGTFKAFLLEGITGSGKTEVYLHIIEAVLKKKLCALVLVPEIGLTPQTVARFRHRFNLPVSVLHSGLSAGERLHDWQAAMKGDARIIIGTRSAVFTPIKDLGIIIIDEEHDLSYKQQDGLRYSARDTSIVRAHSANIPVLLASATPSLESLYNAEQSKYQLLQLQKRAGKASPPAFALLDIRNRPLIDGLAQQTIDTIRNTLVAEEQVLVFVNRRGFAPALICHACGWIASCERCNKPFTLHLNPSIFHCHHCDTRRPLPNHCPRCHSTQIRPIGVGTERAEEGLVKQFPDTPVYRIDRDSTRSKAAMQTVLTQIGQGKPAILVGTQMLSKGHHFPQVTLVVILEADSGFFSADFRAPERTGQMITQVSGRAGRVEKPGKVLIQTHQPGHPQLTTLINQGYGFFARQLLEEREEAKLPPWQNAVIIRAESVQEKNPYDFLHQVRDCIAQILDKNSGRGSLEIDLIGPFSPAMSKKAGRHRAQLVLQSTSRAYLRRLLEPLCEQLETLESARKVRWSIDVDPQDSM